MIYEEIKEVEIDRIISGVRRLLDIGFSMEEIKESTTKGVNQMILNLPKAKLYEIEIMQKIKKRSKKENDKKSDIK